jgi:excisionase family DNA binding protein
MNDILTAQDLSEYLKITTTTIYKLAQQGKIPCFKIGSEWRFKKELIDKWLESGRKRAALDPRVMIADNGELSIAPLQRFSRWIRTTPARMASACTTQSYASASST